MCHHVVDLGRGVHGDFAAPGPEGPDGGHPNVGAFQGRAHLLAGGVVGQRRQLEGAHAEVGDVGGRQLGLHHVYLHLTVHVVVHKADGALLQTLADLQLDGALHQRTAHFQAAFAPVDLQLKQIVKK